MSRFRQGGLSGGTDHKPSTSKSEHNRVRQSNYRITDSSLSSGCSLQHCNRLQHRHITFNLTRIPRASGHEIKNKPCPTVVVLVNKPICFCN